MGKSRRLTESARQTQAVLANYHTVLLTLEGEIAQTYFALRITDEELDRNQRRLRASAI